MLAKPKLMLSLVLISAFGVIADAPLSAPALPTDQPSRGRATLPHEVAATQVVPVISQPEHSQAVVPTIPAAIYDQPAAIHPKPAILRQRPEREHSYSALPFDQDSAVSTLATGPWHLSRISAPAQSGGSTGPIVAIIDTGFALAHTSLASRWWTNPGEMGPTILEGPAPNCTSRGLVIDKSCNNRDNDGDGYPSNWRGWDFDSSDNDPQTGLTDPTGWSVQHGTFVAGLVGAATTDSSGGVDQTARLMPLQALDDNGDGYTSSVAEAIVYAADHGADVINLSLGTDLEDPYLHAALTYARDLGAVIVAAAGNDGCNCLLYPANYPEVIAVGATDEFDTLSSFSSYGANLDFVAPGQNLCSTSWSQSNPTTYYQCGGSGTSFAAPIASGVISRLIAAGVSTTLSGQYAAVTADKPAAMDASWRTDLYGTGRTNLTQALAAIAQTTAISTPNAIVRFACEGINECSLALRNATGGDSLIKSKQVTGQAAAIYWQTSVPTESMLWVVTNTNLGTVKYFRLN